jgi:hypothetical protein
MTTGPEGTEARLKVWSDEYTNENDLLIQI